jgi:quercetin dioxygenase-like cupin family protein
VIVDIKSRSIENFNDFHHHPGEEYVYILEGTVDFHTEVYAPARLSAGDSIYFDSEIGHAWIAVDPGPCRMLSVCLRSRPAVGAKAAPEGDPAILDISQRRRSAG